MFFPTCRASSAADAVVAPLHIAVALSEITAVCIPSRVWRRTVIAPAGVSAASAGVSADTMLASAP